MVVTYPLDGTFAGARAAFGGVWITQPSDDAVPRVDPSTVSVVSSITVGEFVTSVATSTNEGIGPPGGIRTPDLLIRSQSL